MLRETGFASKNENRYHFGMSLRPPVLFIGVVSGLLIASCGSDQNADSPERPSVVVTHSLLGAVVSEVVGDVAEVTVLIADGTDPHDWEPSAKDIEHINNADLVVANGLGLESSLEEVLENAVTQGVPVFEATDHITIRDVTEQEADAHADEKAGEDDHAGEEADAHADEHHDGDPHFWTDAREMANVAEALGEKLFDLGIEVGDRAGMTAERLMTLDNELSLEAEGLIAEQRVLVTGHESLGYFADRYGFTLVGAVIPSLSTQAEVSAAAIAELKELIAEADASVIFSELGTPSKTVSAIASETGAKVVEVATHLLPEDGSYETFMRDLMRTIVEALKS